MENKTDSKLSVLEWYDSLVFALVFIVLVFVFLVRVVMVSGVSMVPTLQDKDRLLVQSIMYTPKRSDVVVIDGYIDYGKPVVKRIIAVGGDIVNINEKTNEVSVNGTVLEEPYIAAPTFPGNDYKYPLTVPEGKLFVMGDNRTNSMDSRAQSIGFVDYRDVLGKVLLRILPFGSAGKIA
ncbi:MAG: signal peptidase I [Oscillospiraceae bacterium]